VSLALDGRYFVDSYSKPDVPPVAVLRDAAGRVILTVQTADISRLLATGWRPPLPFTVKARDGRTDLYGLLFRPASFDSTRRYPIVNNIYPGPQTGSVGSRSFSAARGDNQALAELGFVVVQLDAMGTPMRSGNLRGKLLLAHGTADDNVPPYNTLLLVDALIRANKDFDLLLPNRRHGFGSEPYMVRRRWDYFVRNLMGAEPPAGYELHPPAARGRPGR